MTRPHARHTGPTEHRLEIKFIKNVNWNGVECFSAQPNVGISDDCAIELKFKCRKLRDRCSSSPRHFAASSPSWAECNKNHLEEQQRTRARHLLHREHKKLVQNFYGIVFSLSWEHLRSHRSPHLRVPEKKRFGIDSKVLCARSLKGKEGNAPKAPCAIINKPLYRAINFN